MLRVAQPRHNAIRLRPMAVQTKHLTPADLEELLALNESHFIDLKSAKISPAKLSRTISGFANASGGELFIGIEELEGAQGVERRWDGFTNEEAANPIFQVLEGLNPLGSSYEAEFLSADGAKGLVLHLTVFKTQKIVPSTDGTVFRRRSAQNLPVTGDALERLKLDKGIGTFEDERLNEAKEEITNSNTIIEFLLETVPTGEPESWLSKQRVLVDGKPTVAGVLLYSDLPQALLPKRSAVKILRYATKKDAERDF
jgi:ATP-dependent DNA helicase RecG